LTTYLLGFGLGQLIFGPISDRFGRRTPLLASSTLCVLSSVAVATAPTLDIMAVCRFFQAFGAAGGVVIARAVVSDSTTGFQLVRTMNVMMGIAMFAPVISPTAGSLLLSLGPWHTTLWAIIPVTFAALVGVACLVPDTLPPERRTSKIQLADIGRVFTSARFTCHLVVSAAATGALMAYTGASPFLYQSILGFSELEYGIFYAVNAAGMIAAMSLSAHLAGRHVRPSLTLGAGCTILVTAAIAANVLPLGLLAVVLFVATASHGLITGNASALALAEVRGIAGAGSAAIGGAQFLTGALTVAIVGAMGAGSSTPYTLVLAICALTGLIGFLLARRQPSSTVISDLT